MTGTYLVVELERRPSTPAGALTAFMGLCSQQPAFHTLGSMAELDCGVRASRVLLSCFCSARRLASRRLAGQLTAAIISATVRAMAIQNAAAGIDG